MARGPAKADILVGLDELWDTRMGTLDRMGPEIAEKVLFNGYHERDSDVFDGVDMDEYKRLYDARDVETLQHSVASQALPFIFQMLDGIAEQMITRPYYQRSRLVVNYHPYQLSDEELEMLWKSIRVRIKDVLPVVLINEGNHYPTPEICRSDYGALIVYDAEAWINFHMKELEKKPIPEILLLTPKLFHRKKPTPQELEEIVSEAAHPFNAYEWMMMTFIELKMVEVEHFSILKPA